MSGYKAYQGNQVNTANPLGLVLLSYEALYKSLGRTFHAIEGGDLAAEADHTARAMEAIIELSSSLDMEAGEDVAASLLSLYNYMSQRLSEGMCSCSTDAVEEVMLLVTTLREGWERLAKEQENEPQQVLKTKSVAAVPQSMKLAMGYAA